MVRRFKQLGLAALAVCALTAMSASAASAATEFHATAGTSTFIHGVQEGQNTFTVNGGNVKCTGATFATGEIKEATVKELTVTPTYTGCTAFGQAATVTTTGCDYVLTPTTAILGEIHIKCETGKSIVVKANTAGCTVTVAAQTPTTSTIHYEEKTTATPLPVHRTVKITSTVAGIHYTSSGGICGASGTNGTYTGAVLAKGYEDAALTKQKSIWVE